MVISTGMTLPRWDSVAALYCLQKSMMLTPCGPSAVPTGGAGVACPACSWTFTKAAIFFLGGMPLPRCSVSLRSRLPDVRATRRSDHGRHVGTLVASDTRSRGELTRHLGELGVFIYPPAARPPDVATSRLYPSTGLQPRRRGKQDQTTACQERHGQ